MSKRTSRQIVLVTVSGPDKPGITSELTRILSESGASILDIGQAVIHGLLSLSILFELRPNSAGQPDNATIKDLLFQATELGLKLDFRAIDPEIAEKKHLTSNAFRYAITMISENLSAKTVHQVTSILATYGLNIDRIQRLSEGEFGCIELLVSSTEELNRHKMKKDLLNIASNEGVDIALQAEGLFRRTKRLIVLDMDSTLLQQEVVDEFARKKGVYAEVSRITEDAMKGKLDFDESLQRRCEKLAGLNKTEIDDVYKNLKLTHGSQKLIQTLKKLGYKVALISGGFACIADRIREDLGLDYAYANQLEFQGDELTGKVIPPIVNAQRKADLLDVICQQERIQLDQVVAVGDGANDLLMLEKAGLGIAFNAKALVQEKADLSLNQRGLTSIFYLLGISGRDLNDVLQS